MNEPCSHQVGYRKSVVADIGRSGLFSDGMHCRLLKCTLKTRYGGRGLVWINE